MTLNEAIIHAEEMAKRNEEYAKIYAHGDEFEQEDAFKCEKCAEEHRQLAEWLKELKQYKEQEPTGGYAVIDGKEYIATVPRLKTIHGKTGEVVISGFREVMQDADSD